MNYEEKIHASLVEGAPNTIRIIGPVKDGTRATIFMISGNPTTLSLLQEMLNRFEHRVEEKEAMLDTLLKSIRLTPNKKE